MLLACAILPAHAAQDDLPAGVVKTLTGNAQIEHAGKKSPLAIGSPVYPGDRVSTGAGSGIGITLRDNTQLSTGAASTLVVNNFSFNPNTNAGAVDASLKRGTLSAISGKVAKANPEAVQFNTATVTLGVRGTEFIMEAADREAGLPQGLVLDGYQNPVRTGSGDCLYSNAVVPLPIGGCDPKPDRIVLLPDPLGHAGAVIVKSASTTQVLDQSFASLEIAAAGSMQSAVLDAAAVRARYGDLLASMPPRPRTFVVRFESGSASRLTADSLATVESLKQALGQWPAPEISVVGHTDRTGNAGANDVLSLERARTVQAFLTSQGVAPNQIEVAGRGENEPLEPTGPGIANAANRRVEITVR